MKNLQGKTAVLTGAGSGIGRALAIQLSREGVRLALSDINEVTLNETVALCDDNSVIRTNTLDVASRDNFLSYADDIMANFGPVDIVINNAGIAIGGAFEDFDYSDIDAIIGVNLYGVI